MTTINGVINKVAPRTVISEGGKAFRTHNGIRQLNYDKWGMVWNGNHFAPPEVSSVLYLPGVPGAGSTIFDFSGSGNDGTVVGATWTQLPTGLWYLDFDGTNDVVTCGSDTSVDALAAMTLMVWMKPDTIGEQSAGRILNKVTALETNGWELYLTATTKIAFFVDYDGAFNLQHISDNGEITLDSWQMVALTWDGAATGATALIYNNGVEIAYASTVNGAGNRLDDSGSSVRIGNDPTSARTFDGGIGLPRIFNAVLTAAQIASIYNQERHLFGV